MFQVLFPMIKCTLVIWKSFQGSEESKGLRHDENIYWISGFKCDWNIIKGYKKVFQKVPRVPKEGSMCLQYSRPSLLWSGSSARRRAPIRQRVREDWEVNRVIKVEEDRGGGGGRSFMEHQTSQASFRRFQRTFSGSMRSFMLNFWRITCVFSASYSLFQT